MIFNKIQSANDAFVWIFLPGNLNPIVAGQITKQGEKFSFHYGRSYLENQNAIPLSPFELALESNYFIPDGMNIIHSCLRDASPDAWGRRLIDFQYSNVNPNELDYMLLSGSNRIGALDFQRSSTEYLAREINHISLENFSKAIEWIEKQQPLPPELEPLLWRGTSIGGARPKAIIQDNHTGYIAKFSLSTDPYDIIKSEFIGMKLAKLLGLEVAETQLYSTSNKKVLFVKRFDRIQTDLGTTRRLMLSGLSLLGLNEMEARYASYRDFADVIRQRFTHPKKDLLELFQRLVFNILIGNTDDHARNHSAFWDGKNLQLTPAYDLCPQPRVGQIATQAMALEGIEGNYSTLSNVLSISESFQIPKHEALDIIERMVSEIKQNWEPVCDEAELSTAERERLWKKVILNPFCFQK